VVKEFELLGPQEAVRVEGELVEALLGKAFAGCEVGRVRRERRKREEGVDRDAPDVAKVFGEGGRYWSDFLVDPLVLVN
jgi:hypothetical protein